jgi:F0F1-type ATP synthase membrane subunit b/b'
MSIQLIVIQVLTFIGIIIVLRIMFSSQLNAALARLKALHEENVIKEEELAKELEEARQEKEKTLHAAREEAAAIIKEAKSKAEKAGMEFEAKSKAEAQRKFDHVDGEIEKIKGASAASSHEKAVDFSTQMLEAVFTERSAAAFHHELIDELLEEIKDLDKSKFTVKTKDLEVISACPVAAEDKAKLAKILSDKVGMRVDIKESIDRSVVAGLIIKIGALTIDGSLKNKLRKILPHLK